MAILPPTVTSTIGPIGPNDPYLRHYPYDSNTSVQTYDHTINGKMFLATLHVPYDSSDESDSLSKLKEDEAKSRLTEKLLHAMIEGKCVAFTKSLDPISGSHTYRARCFVTPDAQVKILRTHRVIK
jgi:hypothetical protein